jgi:hypothetical protein
LSFFAGAILSGFVGAGGVGFAVIADGALVRVLTVVWLKS